MADEKDQTASGACIECVEVQSRERWERSLRMQGRDYLLPKEAR
jgi:hypothetical protein